MNQKSDVLVLGAGIVGVCIALHLQARGRSVVLVDRRGPGEETSHGNAGLIERSSVVPYAFPRNLRSFIAYATNSSPAVRYEPRFLLNLLPWLARYWWHSSPMRLAHVMQEMLPLIEQSVVEHDALARQSGVEALVSHDGWIEVYRSPRLFARAQREAEALDDFSLNYEILEQSALRAREPALSDAVVGAVHWRDPATVRDPGAVTRAYAELFLRRGGSMIRADARTLEPAENGWSVRTESSIHTAREAVVALGPWSDEVYRPLGYKFPMAVKRGYHLHYGSLNGAALQHPVCDVEAGFVLNPMTGGMRLTTGIELASRDAPINRGQLQRAEAIARTIFPLASPVEGQPWIGSRPCLPDMKPVIGLAGRHEGLWFSFGHAHHGFTLGPVTGRLLAERMTGAITQSDIAPFSPDRF